MAGLQDSIGRKWQCSTIQLDFNLPQRFEMEYTDRENNKQQPIMIHRAIFGSVERFMGILTEDCMGAFPAWLAPLQCRVIPVNAACEDACQDLVEELKASGCRVDMVRFCSMHVGAGTTQERMLHASNSKCFPVITSYREECYLWQRQ